jgi:hypothetical protein
LAAWTSPLNAASPPSARGCAPTNGLSFVCGALSPEDATPIPGTRWLLASGRKPGEGIKLIDTVAKTARPLFTGDAAQMRPDAAMFPNCPEPLNAKTWISHGLFLRAKVPGRSALYVVEDGPLPSVQVFDVSTQGAEPALTWKGCVPLPEANKAYANLGDVATSQRLDPNSVAAFSDGSILVSVPRRPGTTPVQRFNGAPTGDVLEWKPGAPGFHIMQGVQVPYANGIEISPDESEFYVAAYSAQKVYAFSRQDPLMPIRELPTPGIMPDNLRWSGDRLIVAGMMYDEPACGGTQLATNGSAAQWSCHRGFMVGQIDPKTAAWTIIAYSEPNPAINVVSTGIIVGDTLWIGASSAEGVAYRPLPHLPASPR